jgi:hypothetical protein
MRSCLKLSVTITDSFSKLFFEKTTPSQARATFKGRIPLTPVINTKILEAPSELRGFKQFSFSRRTPFPGFWWTARASNGKKELLFGRPAHKGAQAIAFKIIFWRMRADNKRSSLQFL